MPFQTDRLMRWVSLRERRQRERQRGFTLLELLVVLGILGLIAAIAVPNVIGYLGKAKTDTAAIEVENLGAALDLFRLDVGRYPSEQEGLAALVSDPGDAERWGGPYLKKEEDVIDPWGNPYRYVSPGNHGGYDLFTYGADNSEGGEDDDEDVVSW